LQAFSPPMPLQIENYYSTYLGLLCKTFEKSASVDLEGKRLNFLMVDSFTYNVKKV
jgi:hypothetical protein